MTHHYKNVIPKIECRKENDIRELEQRELVVGTIRNKKTNHSQKLIINVLQLKEHKHVINTTHLILQGLDIKS